MNKIIFLLLSLLLISVSLNAQNSLSFGQVLNINSIVNQGVPPGKVWKIESMGVSRLNAANEEASLTSPGNDCNSQFRYRLCKFYVNDVLLSACAFIPHGSQQAVQAQTKLPLWLGAGDSLRVSCSASFMNVLEFNVTP